MFPIAVVIAGPPATGKSSALNTIVSALTSARREDSGTNGGLSNIKLVKIYPGVFEGLSDLYGYANPRGDWVDGVFTDAFRKAHKVILHVKITNKFILLLLLHRKAV